ncbi:MAG: hypothetical protein FWD57_04280 [Polyangiaceae bacterium]|nr:hypothetical protein [Polyangiaceae bacterium]
MIRPTRSWILTAITLLATVQGCSSNDNPLLEEAAWQYGLAYCDKLTECVGQDKFDKMYPEGIEDCAARTFKIYGTTERSICPQSHWDTCADDLRASTCHTGEAGIRPLIPDSCPCP